MGRAWRLALAVSLNFTSAGIIFGFPAVANMMADDHVYSSGCADDAPGEKVCRCRLSRAHAPQRGGQPGRRYMGIRYDLIFMVAAAANLMTCFVVGLCLDRWRERKTSIVGHMCDD